MSQAQLPPKFPANPAVAAGGITISQAVMMIQRGWLTREGACFLLPPRAWPNLPFQDRPRSRGAEDEVTV